MPDVLEAMRADRVVAVLRARMVPDPLSLAEALVTGGVRCVEFTFTIPNVLDAIGAASKGNAIVGAGTVMTAEQARAAIDAGASFVVSPACRPELMQVCERSGIPVFLGAFTATEVAAALDAGTSAVKLFPASVGGPRYVKDLRGPYPEAQFIPSGGVDETNARDFLAVGCPAVYAGSKMCPPHIVEEGNTEDITRRARAFVKALG
jgi:2-dehydro-3-deoxyphosphogluconate aldolase/(4S)-4-hydroxy-2-oxoglutarate aldolase